MLKIRKLLISKIITLVVVITFSVTSSAHGIYLSKKSHLRKPLDFQQQKKDIPKYLCIILAFAIARNVRDLFENENGNLSDDFSAQQDKTKIPTGFTPESLLSTAVKHREKYKDLLAHIKNYEIQMAYKKGDFWIYHHNSGNYLVVKKNGEIVASNKEQFFATFFPRIVVIDSGVGGARVSSEIRALLQSQFGVKSITFNTVAPITRGATIGRLSEKEIQNAFRSLMDSAIREGFDADSIWCVACNTFTANDAENIIRKRLGSETVVCTPIKLAVDKLASFDIKDNKKVVIMATDATCKSSQKYSYRGLLGNKYDIEYLSADLLVELIQYSGSEFDIEKEIRRIVSRIPREAGVIILGCTHYSIVRQKIREALDKEGLSHIQLIDTNNLVIEEAVYSFITKAEIDGILFPSEIKINTPVPIKTKLGEIRPQTSL